jgi:hypothetical protein
MKLKIQAKLVSFKEKLTAYYFNKNENRENILVKDFIANFRKFLFHCQAISKIQNIISTDMIK